MFWIALVAQLSVPTPENAKGWFSADDVPMYLLEQGSGLWQVPIRIHVAPDGKIRGCEVETASRVPNLDNHTCRIVMRRARFRPARVEGMPTFGVYRTSIMYVVANRPWDAWKARNPDIAVTVERLPADVESPTFVKVMFAVDANGVKKSSCVADETKGPERVNNHPALVPIACEQVITGFRAIPPTDATGKPVLSVQNAVVRFSEGQ